MTRKGITERQKIDAMMYRLSIGEGIYVTLDPTDTRFIVYFTCGVCKGNIATGCKIHWDHISMDGPNDYKNIRPAHLECRDREAT